MTSQPACACTSDCCTSTSTVSSLRIRPSLNSPSWPWLVNGSSATSHSTPRSGNSFFRARTALQTRLSGLVASVPASSRSDGSVNGNSAMQGMSSFTARSAERTTWSTLSRSTPGIEPTGARLFSPSITNIGQIRSLVVSTFSRISRRAHSDLRLRRGRTARSSEGLERRSGRGASRISIGRPNLIAIFPPLLGRF